MRLLALNLVLAQSAQAHHVKVLGMSVPHALMSLPATLLTAAGAMLYTGRGLRLRKGLSAGFFLASLPLWLIAAGFIE